MKILARILAMADAEVLGLISPRVIRDIKREDPAPLFKAFIIGQEGESRPKIVGVGATVQRWFQSAIEKLTEKLGLGLPVYHNHTPTNKDRNRPPIGEVVGKAMKNIQGSLSSIIVAYIFPQFKDLPLDVASIEAGVMVPEDSREFDVKDVDIQEVTGIALGNSQVNKPAFPGATLVAQLQAMAEKPHQGDNNMTLDEIQKAIQEGKFKPSDVFMPTALTSDPFIKEHVEEKINNAKGYDIRKRQDLEEKVSTLEKDKKALQDELASSKTSVLKTKAKETFEAVLGERPKLKEDGRLSKFVRKQFDKSFAPTDEAKLRDDLNKFVDGQVTEFQELFGEPGKGGGKEKTDAERAAEAAAAAAEENRDKTDLLNPKNNDLIPTEI
jgi:DNA-binding transcriptional MerR regulator